MTDQNDVAPRPWKTKVYDIFIDIVDARGKYVLSFSYYSAKKGNGIKRYIDSKEKTIERANQIVTAVNTHDRLVEALEAANKIIAILEHENPDCYKTHWDTNDFINEQARNKQVNYYKSLITYVLAEAKGEK